MANLIHSELSNQILLLAFAVHSGFCVRLLESCAGYSFYYGKAQLINYLRLSKLRVVYYKKVVEIFVTTALHWNPGRNISRKIMLLKWLRMPMTAWVRIGGGVTEMVNKFWTQILQKT